MKYIFLAISLLLTGCFDEVPITKSTAAKIDACLARGLDADVALTVDKPLVELRDNVVILCHHEETMTNVP